MVFSENIATFAYNKTIISQNERKNRLFPALQRS